MRIISIPARYAKEVEAVLQRMRASIATDAQLSDGEDPFPNGFIEKDESARGTLMIFVAHMPQEMALPAFPLVDEPARMEIAS